MKNLYHVKDIKAQAYLDPFTAGNDNVVKRQLQSIIKDAKGDIGRYPEDFELYRMGTYDEFRGIIELKEEFVCGLGKLI